MTIDCGLHLQTTGTGRWVGQAVTIMGNDDTLERLHLINWGIKNGETNNDEMFVASIVASGRDLTSCHNAIIRDCIADTPAPVVIGGPCSPFLIGGVNIPDAYQSAPPPAVRILSAVPSGTSTLVTTSELHGIITTTGTVAQNYDIAIKENSNTALNGTWTISTSGTGNGQYSFSHSPGGGYAVVTSGTTFTLPIATTGTSTGGTVMMEAGWVYNAKILNCVVQNIGDGVSRGWVWGPDGRNISTTIGIPESMHATGFTYASGAEVAGCKFLHLRCAGQNAGCIKTQGE